MKSIYVYEMIRYTHYILEYSSFGKTEGKKKKKRIERKKMFPKKETRNLKKKKKLVLSRSPTSSQLGRARSAQYHIGSSM